MASDRPGEVTRLLEEIRAGNTGARNQLFERIYQELHQRAADLMRHERPDHTLQPTALVHEAIIRLYDGDFLSKAHNRHAVLEVAARAMRQILVEHARRREADKRGGGRQRLPLDAVLDFFEKQNVKVPALNEGLDHLATLHWRQSRVVELRVFGGCTVAEVAEQLGIAVATVESDFRKAIAFLHRWLTEDDADDS